MIRTILLTHRYTDAISSASVCLFFRMAGIYVVEKYLDFNVDLRTEMIEFGITPEKNLEMFCDAEVALLSTKERQIEYLEKHKIKILGMEVGDRYPRTVIFEPGTGMTVIKTFGKPDRYI